MPSIFNGKTFNGEVFKGYVDRVPNPNRTELIKSRAIRPRPELASSMSDQVGGNYLTTPLHGLINGADAQNYDGNTNIEANETVTFSHSRVVVGRAQSWVERDFSYDITGGVDFMENVAQQIAEYWDEIDQATLVHILNGVFNMTDAEGLKFVAAHTYDVTGKTNSEGTLGCMDGTTMNSAMQRACGDNKGKFSLAVMHSAVATNLENLRLLAYLKYTDANGMQRDLSIGTLNGRAVLVDDTMPVKEHKAIYEKTADTAVDSSKIYYTRTGSAAAGYTYAAVTNPTDADIASYYELTAEGYSVYTTYVLGNGAIEYTDCGAKVPYEVDRDPAKNGGEDTLYSRQRKCWAPYGISFTKAHMETLSPTDDELENGKNWELVNTSGTTKKYIAHKAIPIARILSCG